jgi:hypothetical protein
MARVSALRWIGIALATAIVPLLTAGCETFVEAEDCDPSAAANPTIVYDGGSVDSPCFYSSTNPNTGELLLFNGGMHYALNHHLACTPGMPSALLSFDQFGMSTVGGGQLAQAAGNQAVFIGWNATTIEIENDSCSDYWLQVTAACEPCK